MKRFLRILKWTLFVILTLIVLFVAWFYNRYGGTGKPFPDMHTNTMLPDSAVQVVATLPEPPGNLAVSAEGRIFCTYHAESRPDVKVWELIDGKPVPYPDASWQQPRGEGQPFLDQIFNIRIDRQNRLWTCDHGFHGLKQPRLLAFDLKTNTLVKQIDIPKDLCGVGSYIQDMQIDSAGEKIYVADIGVMAQRPGLLICDVQTGKVRRVLDRHPAITEEPYEINSQGRKMYPLGFYWMHPAFDPIALDKTNEWLYVGPMSGSKLYRIRTSDLNNESLSAEALGQKVEFYANKSQCDGLSMDLAGNIYLTGIEDGSILVIDSTRTQRTYAKHPLMRWPDGLSFGPDGWLYIADSDIPDVMMKSKAHILGSAPFYIFRVKGLAAGIAGQ
ncbi:MAG: L-dopachrome tautomerase-related protein [Bacteroidota bacterium]